MSLLSDVAASTTSEFSSLVEDNSEMQIYDTYRVPQASLATFACENKGISVTGILVEAWQFSMDSKWDNKAVGSIMDSAGLLKLADTGAQALFGASINLPILNRRTWSGTSPFGTAVKLRFIAVESCERDVYVPVLKILNLLSPRLVTGGDEKTILGMFSIPGPAPFGSAGKTLLDALGAKSFTNKLDGGRQMAGDKVTVSIGKTILLGACYLTKVQGSFSKAIGPDGYPLAAELSISFESMDAPFFVSPKSEADAPVTSNRNNMMRAADNSDLAQAFAGFIAKAAAEGAEKMREYEAANPGKKYEPSLSALGANSPWVDAGASLRAQVDLTK